MEHLLQKSKCSIFHNIFKYMIFQRRQKALLWSKGLNGISDVKVQALSLGHFNLTKKHGKLPSMLRIKICLFLLWKCLAIMTWQDFSSEFSVKKRKLKCSNFPLL